MNITYTHKTHPRAKSIKIKIENNGAVVVVTPRGVPQFLINQFVQRQRAWIAKHLTKVKFFNNPDTNPDKIAIFGQTYQLQVTSESGQPLGVKLTGSTLILNTLNPNQESHKNQRSLDLFLKGTAEKYLFPRVYQLSQVMKIKFSKITIRQQKSRWGSCSSNGTLSFNWRLVHFEPAVIDYVIIHELAHRVYMNHSTAFWQLVKTYDRHFLTHRKSLKQQRSHID